MSAPPAVATLPELLDRAAARHGDSTALVCGDRRETWADLAEGVDALAAALAGGGILPGDAVGLRAPAGPGFVRGLLAITRFGGIAVPLNPSFKPPEVEFCLRAAGVRTVLTEPDLAAAAPARSDLPRPGGDADAVFGFSSGATGRPKGVPRTHRQLAAEAAAFATATGLVPGDRILCALPLLHTYGLGCCLLAALHSGAPLVFLEEPGPIALDRGRMLDLMAREAITVFPAVPFQLRVLAESPGRADLSALRLCFSAGNALPRATFDAFADAFGVPPRQLYGTTETGVVTVNLAPDAGATAASVGRPVPGVQVTVLDPFGEPVEGDRHGEIAIRSDAMAHGYAGVPERVNAAAFPRGWFLTGDRGRVDGGGRLYLTGRRKRLIDVKGDKVDPVEVEDVLAVHPRVHDVVVVGIASGVPGEELVKAVVVPDGTCGERELIRYCRERLADYKAPRSVEFRDEIPRNAQGEVLRKYLV